MGLSERGEINPLEGAEDTATPASRPCISIRTFTAIVLAMNSNHKAVRNFLSNLPPKRAIAFVESFLLPDNEETIVIDCDVRRKSCVQVAVERNMSVETVKRYRCKAYHKMSQELFIPQP